MRTWDDGRYPSGWPQSSATTTPQRIPAPPGVTPRELAKWAEDCAEWAAGWGFLDVLAEAVNRKRATETRPQHIVRAGS